MPLEAHFEKRLASYTLAADFSCEDATLAILGPSGSGKTMTLRCIAGLERPDRGKIVLNGKTLFDSAARIGVPSRHRGVGLLFQHYALFPHLNVAQNIAFGMNPDARAARLQRQIAEMHLEGLEHRFSRELSGGEQQRVALARALAIEPQAILLDEPLSALDTYLRGKVEQQLIATLAHFRRPALYVTHSMEEAYRIAPNILVLSKGKVAARGSREQIFRHPPTLEVALLTGLKNFSRARVLSATKIEALDWNCTLSCDVHASAKPAYIGIRAHHIRFAASPAEANSPNSFPCWLVRTSEAPFRVTVYLRLHSPAPGHPDLHADVTDRAPAHLPPLSSGAEPHDLQAEASNRVTSLHSPNAEHHDLQAEITKETWFHLKDQPQPWRVLLPPADLLILAE